MFVCFSDILKGDPTPYFQIDPFPLRYRINYHNLALRLTTGLAT